MSNVSKKKKYKKRRSKNPHTASQFDKHHFLWTKASWNKRYAQQLRMHEYCVVLIPQYTLHKQIHKTINYIPVPSEDNCKAVLEALERDMVNHTISMVDKPSKRLKWLIRQFYECEPATADALKQQLDIVLYFEWQEFILKLP